MNRNRGELLVGNPERVRAIQALYDQSKFSDALKEIEQEALQRNVSPEEWRELLAITGWCHYRMKQYGAARAAAIDADNLKGDVLLATLAGQVDENDEELERFSRKHPDEPGIANSAVLRALNPKSKISHQFIEQLAQRFGKEEFGRNGANILHNAGRFFLAKSRSERDLLDAATYLGKAFTLYGTEGNFHHRAAVANWLRWVYEKLGRPNAAFDCALDSFMLWSIQCQLEKKNEQFGKNLAVARGHLLRLARFKS